jgi:hypothetical protein
MKRILNLFLLVALGFSQSDRATMTIYKDSYALVKQPVQWTVAGGRTTIRQGNLPRGLMLDSPFLTLDGASILRQRYVGKVFSGTAYFQEQIGKEVTIRVQNGKEVIGNLLELSPTTITVQSRKEVYIIPRERIDYLLVKGIVDQPQFYPTLEWDIRPAQPGVLKGDLVYLTEGFDWDAVYRLIVQPEGTQATLLTEAFVKNGSDVDFTNLNLQLVEGELKRIGKVGRRRVGPEGARFKAQLAFDEGTLPTEEQLGDYHIYTIPERMAFRGSENITIRIYDPREITYQKTYLFENSERSQREEPLSVEYVFANTEENNLNVPLPEGKIELYLRTSAGNLEFTGEDRIKQVPRGGTATLIAGRAFDVVGKRRILNYDRQRKSEEASIEIEVTNTRTDTIQVRLIEHITGDWVIREASDNYLKKDASTIHIPLTVLPEASKLVTYTYRKEWK